MRRSSSAHASRTSTTVAPASVPTMQIGLSDARGLSELEQMRPVVHELLAEHHALEVWLSKRMVGSGGLPDDARSVQLADGRSAVFAPALGAHSHAPTEIGRASCRERV